MPHRESGNGTASASSLRIRRATVSDARDIAAIAVAGWQAAYRGMLPDEFLDRLSVESRTRGWQSLLETDDATNGLTLVAERAGRVVGFVSSGTPRDEGMPPDLVEVYAIYVSPDDWREGIGRALLDTVVREWAARQRPAAVLWVLEQNARARAFYEAMGWRPDGGRQLFEFADVSAPEVRYRRDLTGRPDA